MVWRHRQKQANGCSLVQEDPARDRGTRRRDGGTPQSINADAGSVQAVDEDAAGGDVDQAEQAKHEGRLAAPGATHHPTGGAPLPPPPPALQLAVVFFDKISMPEIRYITEQLPFTTRAPSTDMHALSCFHPVAPPVCPYGFDLY